MEEEIVSQEAYLLPTNPKAKKDSYKKMDVNRRKPLWNQQLLPLLEWKK